MSKLLVDAEVIRALADILTETGLSEIEIAEKDQRIRVARNLSGNTVVAPVGAVSVAGDVPAQSLQQPQDLSKDPGAVLSPMIGVAYLTPDPSAPPFVTVGQHVQSGQVILLIEAMKTFNQIRAHKTGKITNILVSSGDPVEYGEALAVIE
ncbi:MULTISPECIES: acetyl-CoA carboxylase biotin carboxyl carrier protein [Commensalibacter]|uniref:Biotin carboxyl carrier protein of acetyl-CoA carboxylase n=2 Tax=Commensalibacter TaxID=1079922 RepID=W7DZ77_9PROT|nr:MULTISPECIES: acetyl-CoA carboxylase biotin carboxyl carrier protein subunit [Commensalibacter]EUK18009.1 acetyl-CoA carboxylase, biotin carboxyl carrier protein [Commensalibacter papalotli (ex Servin-Garciduenas et al. 2014)]CAI3940285.1 Biotin carboxyl carrier protein (AccB) (PDB:1A6X) [Commensalibacter papalotli (ex Botero et al. 2024)]CAI3950763.1 Biotin carboxyl carrier protein (AccB) (PDB:1A6X) [Commensalibacter papalotli (ex Botero et al. 2024)]